LYNRRKKISFYINNLDIRGFVDERNEKIGKKIRDTELNKIPFMLIVGEKEAAENLVSVRKQGQGDLGSMTAEAFAEIINNEIKEQTELLTK
jgi:threonyl-tRNA synthetase